ncbi:uncharacterized protein LOC120337247 isoform X1 [Styela clava]
MSPTNCWNLRVTAEVNQGGRRYMEDVTAVQFERAKQNKKVVEYAAFAIFDGHGGKEAAHFARDNILDNIKCQKGFFSKDVEQVKKSIKDGFIATHHQMWQHLPTWPKTYNGHPSTAGTTVSLVLIRGNKMYVANVGDSMVVMGTREYRFKNNARAFQAMELTVDHKPELPEEKKRIEHCGGCVMNKAGVNRVVWNRPKITHSGPIRRSTKLDRIPFLAIARSLGDLWSFNSELNEFIVSPVPDVHCYDLVDGREQFIVLASDGLWNMVRPYESVTSAGTFDQRKQQKLVTGTPAHELVQLALDRWKMRAMRADNTSVIVVYIERKKMESTAKKRDTYSESWTSARLEGSKTPDDNMPYRNADKETEVVNSDPPTPRLEDETRTGLVPVPLGAPIPPQVEAESSDLSSKDVEPLQDSSISSSSGDIDENRICKPIPKLVRSNRRNRLDDMMSESTSEGDDIDKPSSSNIAENQSGNDDDTSESKPVRRVTRRLSKDIEKSTKRSTRSSHGKNNDDKEGEKKAVKRRKSEEFTTTASKCRKIGSPSERAGRTETRRSTPALAKTAATIKRRTEKLGKSAQTSLQKRPNSAERLAVKSQTAKPAPKLNPVARRKSEPVLARRSTRVPKTPAKISK